MGSDGNMKTIVVIRNDNVGYGLRIRISTRMSKGWLMSSPHIVEWRGETLIYSAEYTGIHLKLRLKYKRYLYPADQEGI